MPCDYQLRIEYTAAGNLAPMNQRPAVSMPLATCEVARGDETNGKIVLRRARKRKARTMTERKGEVDGGVDGYANPATGLVNK